jgi:hypothetical protein
MFDIDDEKKIVQKNLTGGGRFMGKWIQIWLQLSR